MEVLLAVMRSRAAAQTYAFVDTLEKVEEVGLAVAAALGLDAFEAVV